MDGYNSFNNLEIIKSIDDLKKQVDLLRPLSKEQEGRIMQKFRLDWNYHSNAIEGNTLDYGETVAFLMHGITAKGKPFKDYLDIKGHNAAIDYLLDFIRSKDVLTEKDIRSLHKTILVEPYQSDAQTTEGFSIKKTIQIGSYKTLPNHVKTITGEIHYYATPEDTPILMGELVDWYREENEKKQLHPVILAAIFHHKFASIHPFDDGNGRMSRLLMNLILMQNEYPPVIIKQDKSSKNEYFLSLSEADTGNLEPFIEFIAQRELDSLGLYLKGAHGEELNEPDDLDKEIALFKRNLEGRSDKIELKKSIEAQRELYVYSLKPLIEGTILLFQKLKDMFLTFGINGVSDLSSNKLWKYVDYYYLETTNESVIPYSLKTVNGDEVKENWLDYNLSIDSKYNYPIIAFRLNEFKLVNNPFGLELKYFILLNEYDYSIYYSVSEFDELNGVDPNKYFVNIKDCLLKKPYHQKIGPDEIEKSINKVGREVMSFVKMKYENPDSTLGKMTNEDIKTEWFKFLENNKNKDSLKDVVVFYRAEKNTLVFEVKEERLIEMIDTIKYDFFNQLRTKFMLRRGMNHEIEVNDLPF